MTICTHCALKTDCSDATYPWTSCTRFVEETTASEPTFTIAEVKAWMTANKGNWYEIMSLFNNPTHGIVAWKSRQAQPAAYRAPAPQDMTE